MLPTLVADLPGHEGRNGYFMHTFSGTKFFPLDPRPDEINIVDIAHGLAHQCRFNGQTTRFYSVAEHAWHCSYLVPPEFAFEALLHDAAEAYVGDIIRPLKLIPDIRAVYTPIEEAVERVIAGRYGLTYPWPAWVKKADEMMVTAEMEQIIRSQEKGHLHDSSVAAEIEVQCLEPVFARERFLMRFHELQEQRHG
jgi:uncharacterized protein